MEKEIPIIQREEIRLSQSKAARNAIHQPIVVVVDNSSSMRYKESGATRSNLRLTEDMVNEIGNNTSLSQEEQQYIDFCVLNFHDTVEVLQNWTPLSQYERHIHIEVGGCTSLFAAVIQSLYACKELLIAYKIAGISCKRPQIFLFTDGYPTDHENEERARTLCQYYLENAHPKCRMHSILLPGASDRAVKRLSREIRTYATKDCKNGLPAALDFINSSIVTFSRTAAGRVCMLNMDARYMLPAKPQGFVNKSTGVATVPEQLTVVEEDDTSGSVPCT